MLASLTAGQYRGWMAFLTHYHLAPDRDDVHWGMLISSVRNTFAGEGDAVSPAECMPYHDPYEEELSVEQLLAKMGFGR